MKCSKCGNKTFVITITKSYERLCDDCLIDNKPYKIDGKKCKEVIDRMMKCSKT